MSVYECPIRGVAEVHRVNNEPRWVRTDPEIHVSDELLEDEEAVARFGERYEIGEPCPHAPFIHHARLRDEEIQ